MDGGQVPVTITIANPSGPSRFPARPTVGMSQPYSGARATSRDRIPYRPMTIPSVVKISG